MNGGLIITLQQIINHVQTTTGFDYVIADYLLRNLDSDNLSISKVAEDCHISKASVTRFAQSLGYEGFSELKRDFEIIQYEREELKLDYRAKQKPSTSGNLALDLQDEFAQVTKDFHEFSQQIDFEAIETLCDLIYNANDVYIISTLIPEKLSQVLQTTLLNSGKVAYSFPSINQQYNIPNMITKDDLALFVSLEGSHISQREMTLSITNTGATSALITQNPDMKLNSVFDHIHSLGDHDIERSGKYKLLMFIEYFSHFYMRKYAL
jgi:DNA-binding MurR/RpiR family transcriptional regulator